MIPVDRSKVKRPAVLDHNDPNSLASKERKKAIAHFKDPTKPKPKFEAYRHDSVKLALIELFNGKCAYCESRVNATSSRDIEHFRPKGQIDPGNGEEVLKPGYYWLAADWDNLLLSCPACNRSQRQLERDAEGKFIFADESTGKLDLFPLREGAVRVEDPDADIGTEEEFRLLMNPCIDKDPSKYVYFDKNGNIIPRRIQGEISDRAKTSIEVFQLKRLVLVEARKETYLDIVKWRDDLESSSQMVDILFEPKKDVVAAAIRRSEDNLLEFTQEKKAYAGMSRWLMRPILKRIEEVKKQYEDVFNEPFKELSEL